MVTSPVTRSGADGDDPRQVRTPAVADERDPAAVRLHRLDHPPFEDLGTGLTAPEGPAEAGIADVPESAQPLVHPRERLVGAHESRRDDDRSLVAVPASVTEVHRVAPQLEVLDSRGDQLTHDAGPDAH